MATQTVRIEGLKELRRKLEKLSDVAEQDVLEQAAKAGAEVWRDAAEAKAPGPHIEVEVLESSSRSVTAGVGPDKAHWYYKYVELGTAPHTIRGAPLLFGEEGEPVYATIVRHPGAPARPFLRPAADEKWKAAAQAAADVLRGKIDELTE